MRKIISKIKKLATCLTLVIIGITEGVLFGSCTFGKNESDFRKELDHIFNITLSKEWEQIYHNSGAFDGWQLDGTNYSVFNVSEYDEDFFWGFSDVKDEEFEKYVEETIKTWFDGYNSPIDPQYLFDLHQPYEWFVVKTSDDTLMMIYQSQRLHVFAKYM